MSPRRAWLLAWLGGPLIGIANGTARELLYKDRVGELAAHQLSTGTALGLFAGYFDVLARRHPLPSTRVALQVGVAWLALTVAFEFGFGRGVAHTSWEELLADYDVRKGRLWPLVLAWILLGPAVVRLLRETRDPTRSPFGWSGPGAMASSAHEPRQRPPGPGAR